MPVWTGGNAYFNGAKPISKEKDSFVDAEHEIKIELTTDGDEWKLDTNLFDYLPKNCGMINTETLGMAFEPEQRFENPDGTGIVFDTDIYGNKREGEVIAGPFAK